ncbi:MAG TPA: 4a-hydroxytetrahydrobiopterin dehydratase [Candidatus Accumulibacter phosphatis]|nr:MAG: putative pterin-4-alpha-carbinolamine dehydratase [Candidatus Accumulibacter sp. SK-11]HAY27562.1 4a-hydroxytetrahydrobiopterin dehydratase [Accumulibacter sp.]HRL78113.1 4a-hydroxytetrahydrobiopterin dehydratase [Candidatus Accumulibacter phosphatis]HCN67298.1 4a-hydroxytetrahydrobiopterin dehydratase [Accumulibacter sp.]HCV13913.1 4a-hydroxytetrahydrobiopterin dehydratase [Accumulibacter sp.]
MSGQQDLAGEHCRPLRGSEHAIDPTQAAALLSSLLGWQIDETGCLQKAFGFSSYTATMLFVNMVAGLAERENHHPDLEVGYGRVIVRYSTHDVGGLSRNDFVCAAKIEALARI